jgi:predicted Zn-dependent protease
MGTIAQTMRKGLGIQVTVRRRVPVPPSARDAKRHQLVSELLVQTLQTSVPETRDGRTAVIGITVEDMYPKSSGWRWAFAQRTGATGVVSAARMDPRIFGLEANDGLLQRRIRKYALRYGAFLALDRQQTTNPRSVLSDSVLSVDDLDLMEIALAPRPRTALQVTWVRNAESACHAAGAARAPLLAAVASAPAADAAELIGRLGAIDRQLVTSLKATRAGAPTNLGVVTGPLQTRGEYLRALGTESNPSVSADGKHIASLTNLIHAGMLEIGSRVCASESD